MDVDLMWKIKRETNKIIGNIDRSDFDSSDWHNLRCEDVERVYTLYASVPIPIYRIIVGSAPPNNKQLRDYIGDKLRAKFNLPILVELEW